jgi:molybdenum cofactor cytidylyltransferase
MSTHDIQHIADSHLQQPATVYSRFTKSLTSRGKSCIISLLGREADPVKRANMEGCQLGIPLAGSLRVGDEGTERGVPWISVVLLAAGESKRMGQPKQLMPLGKTTILEQTISNFLNSEAKQVIVVLGHLAEDMMGLVAGRPVTVVVNPAYRQGMGTSLACGLGLVSDKAQGVMLALAEQPFIGPGTINQLIETSGAHSKGIVIPCYGGRRGHPVIFATKYKEELLGLRGDVGGREIIARHPGDVLEVAVDCEGVITDIDTLDSYNLELGKINRR